MSQTAFSVDVVEFPACSLAGLVVRTSMSKAAQDCPAMWMQHFGPRMHELGNNAPGAYQGESYGISIMVDMQAETFDYYAAMPLAADKTLPEGMQRVDIPAGLYAKCEVPTLGHLTQAYIFMYSQWVPGQSLYVANPQGACFERYDDQFMKNGSFTLYVPLLKKG